MPRRGPCTGQAAAWRGQGRRETAHEPALTGAGEAKTSRGEGRLPRTSCWPPSSPSWTRSPLIGLPAGRWLPQPATSQGHPGSERGRALRGDGGPGL